MGKKYPFSNSNENQKENKLIKDMVGFYGEIYRTFDLKNIEDINS